MNIILNGRPFRFNVEGGFSSTEPGKVSYGDVVKWAGYAPGRILSVTYCTRRSGDEQRQGTLIPGKSTPVEDGMVFDVCDTSNA